MHARNLVALAMVTLLSSAFSTLSGAADSAQTLECSAVSKDDVSHNLTLTEEGGAVTKFSYLSSVRTPGLATNCTIDSGDVHGTPVVAGDATTFKMQGDDLVVITKSPKGWVFDLSKLKSTNYCDGTIALRVVLKPGVKKCGVVSAPLW